MQEHWLPELQEITGTINASFSANFRHIGCAGEVSLGVVGVPFRCPGVWRQQPPQPGVTPLV